MATKLHILVIFDFVLRFMPSKPHPRLLKKTTWQTCMDSVISAVVFNVCVQSQCVQRERCFFAEHWVMPPFTLLSHRRGARTSYLRVLQSRFILQHTSFMHTDSSSYCFVCSSRMTNYRYSLCYTKALLKGSRAVLPLHTSVACKALVVWRWFYLYYHSHLHQAVVHLQGGRQLT